MTITIIQGDALEVLRDVPADSIHLIITSPPYFQCRRYGNETLGREPHPLEYVRNVLEFTQELKRVLHPQGSFYINIGDTYFGTKGFIRNKGKYARKTDNNYKQYKIVKQDGGYLQHKQLLMLPERIAIGMQEQGWVLRNKIVWEKPNAVPNHSRDRRYPVYENIYHFVKSRRYYFDLKKAKELNHHRDVIHVVVKPFKQHQAAFPLELIKPLVLTTARPGDTVLDPFAGSGTTGVAAVEHGCNFIGIELIPEFCELARQRIQQPLDI